MAEVPFVNQEARVQPRGRPLEVVGVITDPPAASSDSHLGGFARGRRFIYLDAAHFVWWAPVQLPRVGYGSGAYGAGPYSGHHVPGYGSGGYGAGAYGKDRE